MKYFVFAFITYGTKLTACVNTVLVVNKPILQYVSCFRNCSIGFQYPINY